MFSKYSCKIIEIQDIKEIINMALIAKELIERARNVDFKDFLEKEGYYFKNAGSNCYMCTKHDSFMLNRKGNMLWYNWYSKNEKGNIISYVQSNKTNGDFRKAIEYILNCNCSSYSKDEKIGNEEKKIIIKGNVDIEVNQDMRRTFGYLINTRKINCLLVKELIEQQKIIEDKSHNVIFKYINSDGFTVGGEAKGTYSNKSYTSVVKNSNEAYGFTIVIGKNIKNIIVFEASIDLISYFQMYKSKLQDSILLSLAGSTKIKKIATYLKLYKTIDTIIVCVDNDNAGDISFSNIQNSYKNYEIYDARGILKQYNVKDFNELLKKRQS